MDNDDYRRNVETIHKKYGYGRAVEVSLYLIKCAFKLIYSDLKKMDNNVELVFLYNKIIYENLGKNGLVGGQSADLNFLKKKIGLDSKNDYKNLIYKKTTTLFNLCFALSYILFDTTPDNMEKVLLCSKSFGLVFQLYDDFTDIEQDKKSNTPNFILKYGHAKTYQVYTKNVNRLYLNLGELNIDQTFIAEICDMLSGRVRNIMETLS
jgi:geranylgeranyl pyrophosphate synthase